MSDITWPGATAAIKKKTLTVGGQKFSTWNKPKLHQFASVRIACPAVDILGCELRAKQLGERMAGGLETWCERMLQ